jgi:nucleotide-binding universal stress UspA family protein
MIEKKWVIAAVDFSEISATVVRAGHAAAEKLGARLMVLHVVEALTGEEESGLLLPGLRRRVAKVREEARGDLDRLLGEAGLLPSTDLAPRLAEGKAWRQIVQRAQPAEAGLLVVGSPHPGVSLETTLNHVVHHSEVPVLVVRRPPHDGYRRILAGLDFSAESEIALAAALSLAEEGARVIGCHVVEGAGPVRDRKTRPLEAKVRAWAQARFRHVPVSPRVAAGEPGEVLVALAREERADLLAIGVRSRGVLGDFLMGPVAQAAMAAGVCDVLAAGRPRTETAAL